MKNTSDTFDSLAEDSNINIDKFSSIIFPTEENLRNITFHIICNEAELMRKVQVLLKYQGFMYSWEKHGKLNIYLNGYTDLHKSINKLIPITKYFSNKKRNCDFNYHKILCYASEFLLERGFKSSHKGKVYLAYILTYLIFNPEDKDCLSKGPYSSLANEYHCLVKTIDRNIKYSCLAAGIKFSNLVAIHNLLEEFINYLKIKE